MLINSIIITYAKLPWLNFFFFFFYKNVTKNIQPNNLKIKNGLVQITWMRKSAQHCKRVYLTFTDINNDASFINLPLSVPLEIMENTPVDTTLYTILYSDRDITDTKIYTATYSDDKLSRLFDLNPSSKSKIWSFVSSNPMDLISDCIICQN